MVTRSHLQLVQPDTDALGAARARLLASATRHPELVGRALDFVEPLYKARTTATGDPLLEHALALAQTLLDLRLDADALAAALLFHAYESSPETARAVREKFGAGVADLCD